MTLNNRQLMKRSNYTAKKIEYDKLMDPSYYSEDLLTKITGAYNE